VEVTREALHHPPFEGNPPIKLNVSARTLGLVYAILAGIATLLSILQIPNWFRVSGLVPVVIVALGASVVADAIIAWGGYQMYRVNRQGKETAIDGMALLVIAQVVAAVAQLEFLGFPIFFLVSMVVLFAVALVFYYLTVISRFPDEAPAS